jgi:hypothetical protein
MNVKITAVAGAAAAAGAALAFGLGQSASAHAVTHTMTFTTHQITDKIINGADVATDKNLRHGVVIGYDVTSCRVNVNTHVARCSVAIARAGGLMYARAHVNVETNKGGGVVTGGTGRFAGATGTIDVSQPQVTIHWTN